jgi:Ulp1 family protease
MRRTLKKSGTNTKSKSRGHRKKSVVHEVVDKDDRLVLVDPFIYGRGIKTATSSFKLCHFVNSWLDQAYDKLSDDEIVKLQQSVSVGRNQVVSITEYDLKTVGPGMFVNDNVVDFWMRWVTRKKIPTESSVHIFSSHFYTQLRTKGYDAVATWTSNRGINIFEKKMTLIPVNHQKHWSLCAVINVGFIDYGGVQLYLDAFQVLVLVHLDSLKLHSIAEISENVRTWLNQEYS